MEVRLLGLRKNQKKSQKAVGFHATVNQTGFKDAVGVVSCSLR
jgi:hypothetical protein